MKKVAPRRPAELVDGPPQLRRQLGHRARAAEGALGRGAAGR